MDFEIPNRWVVLRVERQRSALTISAHDDRGRRRSGRSQAEIAVRSGRRVAAFALPPSILKLIEEALAGLPPRRIPPHGHDPISLPLFLELGPRLQKEADVAAPVLPKNIVERVQPVELAARRGARRRSFRLPLTVLLLEPGLESSLFANSGWFKEESVREHGLRLKTLFPAPPDGLRQALRAEAWDVVVARGPELLESLSVAEKLPVGKGRPRLVIGAGKEEIRRKAVRDLPAGTALLWVGKSFTGDQKFLEEFLYGLIHDHPLHDALRVALSKREKPGAGISLTAGPRSNQGLRLSNAVASLADEAAVLSVPDPARLDLFLRSYQRNSGVRTMNLSRARELTGGVRRSISNALGAQAEFAYERSGLAPLAKAEKHLAEARHQKLDLDRVLSAQARSPKAAAHLRKSQERRVDVALQSLESVPVTAVPPGNTLRGGALYRLRVHVGHRSPESLVTGKPPPLDPLLPPRRKGHTLDVVVYEKDFSLLTPRVQALHLPDLGGSRPVHFDLRAPADLGPARLRIKVYYQNQLLQSFLMEAVIDERERQVAQPSPALRVDLVYSRTARFTNLKAFKPRALSVGVNQDPGGDSHLFMFKVGKAAEAIDLSEAILAGQIGRFRKLLLDATYDGRGNPRFVSSFTPGTPPGEDFYQVIRDLADAGGELYDALFTRMSRPLKGRLRELARSADRTVQFVRDDPNFVFPWSILYDFNRPERLAGDPPPPVCLGTAPGASPGDPDKPCGHGPGDAVYCINGFWGIRHALEVLLARGGAPEDEVTVVERGSRDAAICLAMGAQDEPAQQFVAAMKERLGTGIKVVDPAEDPLDVLWDERNRPAMLIVLGHLETKVIAGEPLGPRIVLAPKTRWFRAESITAREKKEGEWDQQPRSVVLLMACGAGATEVGTLNDFVTALSSVGAAAVVGTECLVFTRLVTLFSQELIAGLWEGRTTLGAAIQSFRRRLVAAGNPLAFVFNVAGNADLVFNLKG